MDEILKLANDMDLVLCKSVTFAGGLGYGVQEDELEAFYRAAFNAGIEAAAKVVKANYRGVYDGDTCASAVRSLEKK